MPSIHERIRNDPDWFFEKILGVSLWGKQREIIQSIRDHRNTSVRSCHGIGKTYTLARAGLWFMFAFPPAIVINTAPTDRQVRHQFWKEFRLAHNRARRPLGGNLQKMAYTIRDDWYALGFSTRETEGGDTADKFQGFHGANILLLIDEASGVKESVFEAVDGATSGGIMVRKVYAGNPTRNEGSFAASFTDPGFNKIQVSAFDIPNVKERRIIIPGLSTYEWVQEMKRKYGEESDVYRVRVLGEPPKASADTYISVTEIDEAVDADRPEMKGETVLGVDVARYGSDSTDMVERSGNKAKVIDRAFSQSITDTAGKVVAWLLEHKRGKAHIDTIGLGAGVFDIVKEDGRVAERCFAVNVARAPEDDDDMEIPAAERYAQQRDQGWAAAKEFLKTAILEKHEGWYELAGPKYKTDLKGRLKIESKEDMKKRKVASPNTADALILTLLPGESEEGPGAWTG